MGKQGRIFGYARVSSTEQNLDRQLQAFAKSGNTGNSGYGQYGRLTPCTRLLNNIIS